MAAIELNSSTLISDASLKAYWRFEGSSNDTKGSHNGTDTNITYNSSYGKFGQGALFNGSSSKIALTDGTDFNPTTSYSISAWVYHNTSSESTIFSSFSTDTAKGFFFRFEANKLRIVHYGSSTTSLYSASDLSVDAWNYVVVTWDGTTGRIYINGVENANGALSAPTYTGSREASIGCITPSSASSFFKGYIDDVGFFNGKVMTPFEIQKIYSGINPSEFQSTSLRSSSFLKAYYRMENANDELGVHNGTDTDITYSLENGIFNKGALLNGSSSKKAIADSVDFKPSTTFSVGAWIKTASVASAKCIFSSYNYSTVETGISFLINSTNKLVLGVAKNTGNTFHTDYEQTISTASVTDNIFHFVVGTYDGASLKLYIDASLDGNVSWSQTTGYHADNKVTIASRYYSSAYNEFFNGSIEDLFFLNGKALSLEEIQGIYNGTAISSAGGAFFFQLL